MILAFLAEDPLGISSAAVASPLEPGRSAYAYVSGNPVSRRDPLGLFDCGQPPDRDRMGCAAGCIATGRWFKCLLDHADDAAEATHFAEAAEIVGSVVLHGPAGGAASCGVAAGGYGVSKVLQMFVAVNMFTFDRQCKHDCINFKCPLPGGRGSPAPCRMSGAPPIWLQP